MRIIETDDDRALASFNRLHWLAMSFPDEQISSDCIERTLAFIAQSRSVAAFRGFMAFEGDQPIGSACCQLSSQRYPDVLGKVPAVSGYVWGVFVQPEHRGKGIGGSLVEQCVGYLRTLGCSRVELHAGESSRPLYERLGFRPTDELAMRI